jgi:hypothetical protein
MSPDSTALPTADAVAVKWQAIILETLHNVEEKHA